MAPWYSGKTADCCFSDPGSISTWRWWDFLAMVLPQIRLPTVRGSTKPQKQFLIIIIRWTTLSHSVLFHSFNYFFILKVTWLEELYASVDFLTMSDTQCYFPAFLIHWRFDSSSINPKPFFLPNYAYKAEYKAENRVILKHNSM